MTFLYWPESLLQGGIMAAWVCTKVGRKKWSEAKERKWKHVCEENTAARRDGDRSQRLRVDAALGCTCVKGSRTAETQKSPKSKWRFSGRNASAPTSRAQPPPQKKHSFKMDSAWWKRQSDGSTSNGIWPGPAVLRLIKEQ